MLAGCPRRGARAGLMPGSSHPQQADTQNERLRQALCSLQSEHAALHQRASALREDNDLKAEHISAIEGIVCRGMEGGRSVLQTNGGYKKNTLEILILKAKYTCTQKALSLNVPRTSACRENWFPKGS